MSNKNVAMVRTSRHERQKDYRHIYLPGLILPPYLGCLSDIITYST